MGEELIIPINYRKGGFCCILLRVIESLLLNFDKEVHIDMSNSLYHNKEMSTNGWDQFFDYPKGTKAEEGTPVYRGSLFAKHTTTTKPLVRNCTQTIWETKIKVKKDILEDVEKYKEKLNQPYFSVHVRRTDKDTEAPRIPNYIYFDLCDKLLETHSMFFLATDDEHALQAFKERYGDKVVYTDAHRSSTNAPVHKNNPSGDYRYLLGREMLIDLILMANGTTLIGSYSNVSRTALAINKDLHFIDINGEFDFNPYQEANPESIGSFGGDIFSSNMALQAIERCGCKEAVETGMGKGAVTTLFLAKHLDKVTGIENIRLMIKHSRTLVDKSNVDLIHGRSQEVLSGVIKDTKEPILFFLDAFTRFDSPLLRELESIRDEREGQDVIVIGGFGTDERFKKRHNQEREEVMKLLEEIYPGGFTISENKVPCGSQIAYTFVEPGKRELLDAERVG